MKRVFGPALDLIGQHMAAYVILNLAFYGLVGVGTVYAFLNPDAQQGLTQSILQSFASGPLSIAKEAYLSGNVAAAAAITFLVNTVLGSILSLTIPSLLIPFAGSFLGLFRALLWGVALAPSSPELARAMVPHSLVLFLEGQGYILAMFGTHVLWASALNGARRGLSGFAWGYLAGLRRNVLIYSLVVTVLAVSAIYEAFEVIYLVR
jgi:hypothetical protein